VDWTGGAHTDDAFWRECAPRLTDNNCQLLRVLIKLLESSREARTLAVACHDLGEFATHYPAGRFLVQDIGGGAAPTKCLCSSTPTSTSTSCSTTTTASSSSSSSSFFSPSLSSFLFLHVLFCLHILSCFVHETTQVIPA